MADAHERGITVGDFARWMANQLAPIDEQIAALEAKRETIFSYPSELGAQAVQAGDEQAEEGMHAINQALIRGEDLASFEIDHPKAASVSIDSYLPIGEFRQLLPGQEVAFANPESKKLLPRTEGAVEDSGDQSGEWRATQQRLLEKYPFLTEFFDDTHAVDYEGQTYFPRKEVANVLVHRSGSTNPDSLNVTVINMFDAWKKTLKDGNVGRLLRAGRGKGMLGLREDEMVSFLDFIDQKDSVYHIAEPSKKKLF